MKLYLAGPMTGYEDFNKPAFHAEAARLRALGFEVVNPAELNEGNDGDWLACMRVDIRALIACDGVALLRGWTRSKGASIEEGLARGLGLLMYEAEHLLGLIDEMPVLAIGVLYGARERVGRSVAAGA